MIRIKILGTGCPKCKKLFENADAAAKGLGVEYEIEKVTDINKIIGYGVMMTPALVIDDKVYASGSVPSSDEIENMLSVNYVGMPKHNFPKKGCC